MVASDISSQLPRSFQAFVDDDLGVNAVVRLRKVISMGLGHAAAGVVPCRPFVSRALKLDAGTGIIF